jgi:hopene-associated glycosyltransferase HpnB
VLYLGIAAVLAAAAWLFLLAGHGGYWRTDQRLPPVRGEPESWPDVVAVIPARDEASVLPATLPTLLSQDYPGAFRVVLVDDGSSDRTASVAAALGRGARWPLRVVRGSAPPPGWAGKPWAMAQGLDSATALAGAGLPSGQGGGGGPGQGGGGIRAQDDGGTRAARDDAGSAGRGDGGYVLFTDADIAWDPGMLRALVAAAEKDGRDLVSQMALLRTETPWERMLVPAFVYFFAQLYPFRRVNRPGGRTAAAAGGCMLVRRRALDRAGGLSPIRAALIDDVALGRLLKRPPGSGRCWLGLSTGVRSIRPYRRLSCLWDMIARSAYTQLRYSPLLLTATVAGLAWVYAVPPAGAIAGVLGLAGVPALAGAGAALAAGAGLAGWAAMTVSYLPMLRLYALPALRAPALPLVAILYAVMTVDSARRHYAGRGGVWKGRAAPARAGQ